MSKTAIENVDETVNFICNYIKRELEEDCDISKCPWLSEVIKSLAELVSASGLNLTRSNGLDPKGTKFFNNDLVKKGRV